MELVKKKSDCCGCTACMSICPKNAINMTADEEGFLYPSIDSALCINCGLCKQVCAFQNGYNKNTVVAAYGLKHKDNATRLSSRSGAAFILISDWILENSGAVYGAAFRKDFTVCHKRALTKEERNAFKGSKYVQSEMNSCFLQVKNDLLADNYVMFSGTACQVAGLYAYLNKCNANTSKLYTVDVVCHGVPSNKIWREFLDYKTQKASGTAVTKADFRDKTKGWAPHYESVWVDNKKKTGKSYAALFYHNDILRPSCYDCKYTNTNRPADFTLADFWGIDKQLPNFNDNQGVSLFLINSEKAADLFDLVKSDSTYEQVQIENCTKANPNLRRTTERPASREDFWQTYQSKGFGKTLEIYNKKIFLEKLHKLIFKK